MSGFVQRILILSVVVFAACSDVTSPPSPPEARMSPVALSDQAGRRIEGSYEWRAQHALKDGGVLYLVQVVFGDSTAADGHTYLLQVATTRGPNAWSMLVQEHYTVSGDTIRFEGSLLEPATLHDARMILVVNIGGERVGVTLSRKD